MTSCLRAIDLMSRIFLMSTPRRKFGMLSYMTQTRWHIWVHYQPKVEFRRSSTIWTGSTTKLRSHRMGDSLSVFECEHRKLLCVQSLLDQTRTVHWVLVGEHMDRAR